MNHTVYTIIYIDAFLEEKISSIKFLQEAAIMTVLSNSNNHDEGKGTTNIEPDYLHPTHLEHYGPLAHVNTVESRLPAFAGELQPGLYRTPRLRKFANPAPLGLSGFALTTFVLGCINMGTRDITEPNMVVGVSYAYGGLVQLLAGMW